MTRETQKKMSREDRRVVSKHYGARDKGNDQRWGKCEVCSQHLPIVQETGMCGPCTFGDASTLLGDW